MRRFVPIRAEGGLVLALIAVIAGGTYLINETADGPAVTQRTTYGAPQVTIQRVDQSGVKPGPIQPRVIEPVVSTPVQAAAPVTTAKPVAPPKKTVVATTPPPAEVTPEPIAEEPGGILPGTDPGGTGTEPGDPPNNPGNGSPCLIAPLCAPTSPSVAPAPSTAP